MGDMMMGGMKRREKGGVGGTIEMEMKLGGVEELGETMEVKGVIEIGQMTGPGEMIEMPGEVIEMPGEVIEMRGEVIEMREAME